MVSLEIGLLALSAVGGALLTAIAGWINSGEAFDIKKFLASAIRAVIAGILVFAAYEFTAGAVSYLDYVTIFLAGAGFDVLGHEISSATGVKAALSTPTA